jgi:hypothetical protein
VDKPAEQKKVTGLTMVPLKSFSNGKANSLDYLQRYAQDVAARPSEWMPWTIADDLESDFQ